MTETLQQNVLINSLVTLNISDHWTRSRMQNGLLKVIGCLLGKQSGRFVQILNSFEAHALELDGMLVVDEEFIVARNLLFKETFPDLEFIGFYITCDNHEQTDEQDIRIQRQALRFNESSFLLKFNTEEPITHDKLSLAIFECVVDPKNETTILFHKIPIKITTELAEQIGLDHVARLSKSGAGVESTSSKFLTSQFGAINTLLQGITLARNYLTAVRQGQVEQDSIIIKDIYKLYRKLSTEKPQDLVDNERKRISDQKLMVLLCALTNTQGALYNFISKSNMIVGDKYHTGSGSNIVMKKFGHHKGSGFMF